MWGLSTGNCQVSLSINKDNFYGYHTSIIPRRHVMGTKFTEVIFLHFYLQMKSYHFLSMKLRTAVQSARIILVFHRITEHTKEMYVLWGKISRLPMWEAAVPEHLMLLVLVGKATRQIVQRAQTFQFWVESKKKSRLAWRKNYIECVNESVMTSMGEKEIHRGLWWRNLKEMNHLEKICLYRMINFKYMLNKYNERAWTRLISFRTGKKKSSCERHKKTSSSIKCFFFLRTS